MVDTDVAFHEFDGDETEDQSTDDGFPSHEVGGGAEVVPSQLRIFQQEQEFGTEGGSGDGGSDYGPTDWRGERIAKTAAEPEVDAQSDEVGESLEKKVRMDAVGAEVDIDRELCGEMEWVLDGEL